MAMAMAAATETDGGETTTEGAAVWGGWVDDLDKESCTGGGGGGGVGEVGRGVSSKATTKGGKLLELANLTTDCAPRPPRLPLRIFIGYDSREDIAFQVCRHSILKHSSVPAEIVAIKQDLLRKSQLYDRDRAPDESTEFSFTRFLTPYLAGYRGWAIFVDCDFLFTADVKELEDMMDDKYAVMCVQHNYVPTTATKMDGRIQTVYPRKNWSSMVLYNCSHPKNRILTPDVVNSQSGAFLHRFLWLDDKEIGSIPWTWNWLVGHNEKPSNGLPPKAIHYTLGGPWFDAYKNCDYAELWLKEREEHRFTERLHKVIQHDLLNIVEDKMNDKLDEICARFNELLEAHRETSALQRLMLLYLQDKTGGPIIRKDA
ncbi:hypothetical protein CBR_g51102 [Chara braunii]|uniref:Uncharacterized protein n=1 Tax=Chara braunii TaxID=69332 RepID=A0A388K627_CHABU|nr:hypothetical protein CBR_g51102 [Chara braunii]|eukprot:GBG65508.1 hypothetical protein CBR_g51102 [Chara braunii]